MKNITYDFSGRTVIVTGAARGIGLAIATAFSASGGDVVMVDLEDDVLREAASELGATAAGADIADTTAVERVVHDTVERTGRVDVLINNAGILRDAVLWKLEDEAWDAVLAVHLGGTFRFARACVPHFRRQRYGRIVNFTSYTGLHGNFGQSNYAAAKAGVIGLTKTMAKELASFGVTVNAISPNASTRMIDTMPEDRRAAAEALIPLRRFGAPEEMCSAVQFLSSSEAGYVTGTVLPVDGGLSI